MIAILLMAAVGQTVNVYGPTTIIVGQPPRSSQAEPGHRFVDLEGKSIVVEPPSPRSGQEREELHARALREREKTLWLRADYLARRRAAWRASNYGFEEEFDRAWSVAWRNLPGYDQTLDSSVIFQMHRSVAPYWPACPPGWSHAFAPVPPSNGSYLYAPNFGSSGQTTPGQAGTGGPG